MYLAQVIKKIDPEFAGGVGEGLNEIAKTPEFVALLEQEVLERCLVMKDAIRCIGAAYFQARKTAHGNDDVITLRRAHYTNVELAVLTAFLRLQSEWRGGRGLEWRYESKP